MQAVFKEARIPVQLIDTEDKTTVAIVFERVNQRGVPLDILQLLTAWTWSHDFLLQKQFEELSGELRPFGFDEVGEDSNLLLRCCSSVLTGKPLTENLIKVTGAEVRDRFDEVMRGVRGAIDFLRDNLKVQSLKNLPYSNLLIPLTVFFSNKPNTQVRMTDTQRNTILRWFWRSCFAKRYNSQPYKNLEIDVQEMAKLKRGDPNALGQFPFSQVDKSLFEREIFRLNNVTSKTFVLMLAQQDPRSFISGQSISLRDSLKEYNRNEFHHLYPKAYIKGKGTNQFDINCLANFCFMSRTDNNHIGARAPSAYRKDMPSSDVTTHEILRTAMCPDSLFKDDFQMFVSDRARILSDYANKLTSVQS